MDLALPATMWIFPLAELIHWMVARLVGCVDGKGGRRGLTELDCSLVQDAQSAIQWAGHGTSSSLAFGCF